MKRADVEMRVDRGLEIRPSWLLLFFAICLSCAKEASNPSRPSIVEFLLSLDREILEETYLLEGGSQACAEYVLREARRVGISRQALASESIQVLRRGPRFVPGSSLRGRAFSVVWLVAPRELEKLRQAGPLWEYARIDSYSVDSARLAAMVELHAASSLHDLLNRGFEYVLDANPRVSLVGHAILQSTTCISIEPILLGIGDTDYSSLPVSAIKNHWKSIESVSGGREPDALYRVALHQSIERAIDNDCNQLDLDLVNITRGTWPWAEIDLLVERRGLESLRAIERRVRAPQLKAIQDYHLPMLQFH